MAKFDPGDRVVISPQYHWAKGATGTVRMPPSFLMDLLECDNNPYGYGEWYRLVKGRKQTFVFYYVEFDVPQRDSDGDGPYRGGEIDGDMLEKEE